MCGKVISPIVSVIIPTYNRGHCIERAITSAQQQTLADIEIIICDDASTDRTRDIVRNRQDNDPRIQLLCLPENQGPAAARNLGMQMAQGEYIAFLDSDDEWLPHKLDYQVKRMNTEPPETGVCFCGAKIVKNGDIDKAASYLPDKTWEHDTFRKYVLDKIPFLTPTILFRRSCLLTVGLMVPEMRRNEDADFLLRLFSNYGLAVIPEVLVTCFLVIKSTNNYFDATVASFPYRQKNTELIKVKLGYWSAKKYKSNLLRNLVCAAIRERRWQEAGHLVFKRLQVFPILWPKDFLYFFKACASIFINLKSAKDLIGESL